MQDLSNYRSHMKERVIRIIHSEDPINLFNRWFHETDFGGNEEQMQ
jgi:pyridoxamine 5'-phosphate oxidase